MWFGDWRFHRRTVLSAEQDMNVSDDGQSAIEVTVSSWPLK